MLATLPHGAPAQPRWVGVYCGSGPSVAPRRRNPGLWGRIPLGFPEGEGRPGNRITTGCRLMQRTCTRLTTRLCDGKSSPHPGMTSPPSTRRTEGNYRADRPGRGEPESFFLCASAALRELFPVYRVKPRISHYQPRPGVGLRAQACFWERKARTNSLSRAGSRVPRNRPPSRKVDPTMKTSARG